MPPSFTSVSIVLLGTFDPDAFRPEALIESKVLSERDGRLSKFRMLVPEAVTQFSLPWSEVMAAKDRVQFAIEEAPYVRICDFAIKAMREASSKSSVRAFGINVESHFRLPSREARDAFGRHIAPPSAWGPWGNGIAESMNQFDELHGGVLQVHMRQPFRDDNVEGYLDVTAGPSSRIPDHTGVYFRTNHHYQLPKSPSGDGSSTPESRNSDQISSLLLRVLSEQFDNSIEKAERIFSETLSACQTPPSR